MSLFFPDFLRFFRRQAPMETIMRLQDIGFYTLEDARAESSSQSSPLWRCELILTDACNFACPYCRMVDEPKRGAMSWDEAASIVDLWCSQGLRNVRFSGGEPTLWPRLADLVARAKSGGALRVAISSNGSAKRKIYEALLLAGADDFSISLDACCAETGDKMAGGRKGSWEKVVSNIRFLSERTYTTVGVVLTEANVEEFKRTVLFAHDLDVADIRIISAAQWNAPLEDLDLPAEVLDAHPILAYRIANLRSNVTVRGLGLGDSDRCPLVLDDMAVLRGEHYPCIIYLREQGAPIGKVGPDMRAERAAWAKERDVKKDPICAGNCLDVCRDYNRKACSSKIF